VTDFSSAACPDLRFDTDVQRFWDAADFDVSLAT
jgi:hypothetical protein